MIPEIGLGQLLAAIYVCSYSTRMHSSRMRTARLRVVPGGGRGELGGRCSDLVPGGGGGRG